MLPALEGVVGAVWLEGDGPEARLPGPEEAGGAREGAAGAEGCHEVGDATVRVAPDLGTGGLEVGLPVGIIAVLVEVDGAFGVFVHDGASTGDGAVASVHGGGLDDLGPVGPEHRLPLGAGVGRQAQLELVAPRGSDECVGDAGVAAAGVEDGLARTQKSSSLCVEHHGQGSACLDRAAGVEPLALHPDLDGVGHEAVRDPVETHHGRVADASEQAAQGRSGLRGGEREDGHVPPERQETQSPTHLVGEGKGPCALVSSWRR